ncbi:STAS domain-containing protein [Photobacterium halotolerans]|uniref:STAS domain-containing protein n=1 Tax=Photobacterium halotolerans TaxID=265726 RepID=A0A7X4WD52_9GAMM|nr:STAS domain-containing protein [Photobacterium halotolerans]NAW65670.1 STAS domain-containing protein [Photobacterium halotolerans]NAW87226.1 STAS domain-containing protein [Photobacterium halotolerans]NAX49341.1 STAS domain-containing protein [Photobacterium halotolerans]
MGNPAVHWQVQENGHYRLSGVLERDTVPAFWQQRREWMPQDAKVTIELSELSRVDSAGMVMLLHLHRELTQAGRHLVLQGVPQQLLTLLRLSHVDTVLAACME